MIRHAQADLQLKPHSIMQISMTQNLPLLDWTVVGAGPAGIAAIGKLIDHGVPPEKIGWLDPRFSVGDLGEKWSRVPSNTTVWLFLDYLHGSKAFQFKKRPQKFKIEDLPTN